LAEQEEGELAVDMYQTPSEIVIRTMVAGVRPEDLDIAITRDMITIRGQRAETYESDDNDFFHKELYWGAFSRTIVLPAEVEIEEAEASEKHGLLTLTLPKIDKNRQSKLKVKAN
jgi:HSP20 family protein